MPGRVVYDMTRGSENQKLIKAGEARSLADLYAVVEEESLPEED